MRALLIQTGFLGDVILSTAVMRELKMRCGVESLDFLTTPLGSAMLDGHPLIDNVIVFDKRGRHKGLIGLKIVSKIIRDNCYERVYSLHKSHRTAALLLMSGVKERIGFVEAACSWVYHKKSRRKDLGHEILRNAAILRAHGLEPTELDLELDLGLSESELSHAEFLWGSEEFRVVIAPGSAWATKCWKLDGFIEISRMLLADGAKIALLGSPEERKLSEEIANCLNGANVCNFVGCTTLRETASLIARAGVLVCNDSAPLHIASACKTPVVSIFCATTSKFGFGPWKVENRIIEDESLFCRPCGSHGGKICPLGHCNCSNNIGSNVVYKAVKEIFKLR